MIVFVALFVWLIVFSLFSKTLDAKIIFSQVTWGKLCFALLDNSFMS